MVLAQLSLAIVPLREASRPNGDSIDALNAIMEQSKFQESNPPLDRSIRNRFPHHDPFNHEQVELLKLHRSRAASEKALTGIQLTINGISAGCATAGDDRSRFILAGGRGAGRGLFFEVPTASCDAFILGQNRRTSLSARRLAEFVGPPGTNRQF